MKFLILLLYYERPILVRNALKSLTDSTYKNFRVAVIDDGSPTPVEPIAKEYIPADFYNTKFSDSQKMMMGSFAGALMNDILGSSEEDVALFLCDDDALTPHYLEHLNSFFEKSTHPAAYSHVYKFNPAFEDVDKVNNTDINKNRFTQPTLAYNNLDASQVAWKINIHKEHNIWFEYPRTKGHDAVLFRQLDEKFGPMPFTNTIGQYKGCYTGQLGQFSETDIWSGKVKIDKPDIQKMTKYSWKLENIIQSYFIRNMDEEGLRILSLVESLFPSEIQSFKERVLRKEYTKYPSELGQA